MKLEASTEAEIGKRLVAYAKNYTARQLVQEADDALGDPQLGSIAGLLVDALLATDAGRIYDIGAGQGTLLARLARLPAFASRPEWRYCAIDFEEELDVVHKVARQLRLTARTDELTIEQFASEPPSDARKIIFCRNVLHELKIGETAELLHNATRLLGPDDTLLIQDLVRFPEGEQNHHCWTSEALRDVLIEIGFLDPLVYE
ncbi:class I SAM-dependent methyltransferase [Croceicoccus hydrothermalis]|uniref:class I SAM-dependent methyltransferase n=1 Tax=Croceicoccus hydrothermalis TaxID=2867964 RepID=UPI001EFBCEC7|nr:class I SAM-dependent methyltransferase [Croceicoccus hydrothermalis]